jgi:hypothetical protein
LTVSLNWLQLLHFACHQLLVRSATGTLYTW